MTKPVMLDVTIRPAKLSDLPHINSIFNYYVANSTCVWTTEPCSDEERKRWYEEHDVRTPVLVTEHASVIVAWGALSTFTTACTFYKTVEISLYVHKDFQTREIGRRLLAELINQARNEGFNSIIAVISSDQEPSLALHRKLGFKQVGCLRRVGYKFNRWLDAAYLQLELGEKSS